MLKERIKVFMQKSMLLLYSQIFDMSIQRVDEYRVFGQSNYAVRRLNRVFKIDRRILDIDYANSKNSLSSDTKRPSLDTIQKIISNYQEQEEVKVKAPSPLKR